MAKKNVEMGERRRTNIDSKRLSTASIPSLSAPEELQLDLRTAPSAAITTTVAAIVEKQPEEKEVSALESCHEPKKEVKFVESTEMVIAPEVEEINHPEESRDPEEESKQDEVITETSEKVQDISKEAEAFNATQENENVEETHEVKNKENINEELKIEPEIGNVSRDAVKELPQISKTDVSVEDTSERVQVAENIQKDEHSVKEKEQNIEVEQTEVRAEPVCEPKQEEFREVKIEDTKQGNEIAVRTEGTQEPGKAEALTTEAEVKPKPTKMEYEYRKAPNPPFMSTALLQPMKAEIPKPRPVEEDVEALRENLRKSEELRELEEELLGEKKAKKAKDLEGNV